MPEKTELKTMVFASAGKWREWLAKNHGTSNGLWLKLYKKDSGKMTLSYAEALDEALCYGWIDGQRKTLDEVAWVIKFTPRRAKSLWSEINREHVARLIREKRMTVHGMQAVKSAKAEGRWDAAYNSPKNMDVPEDFLRELKKDAKAYAFFKTLNKTNTYAIAWRLQTAKKSETRARRMDVLLAKMKAGEKLY